MSGRVLITGSEGFVGGRLAAYLTAQGYEVLGSDMHVPPDSTLRFAADVSSGEGVEALLDWAQPLDAIFHLAAITFVPEAVESPIGVMQVNLVGTVQLVESVRGRGMDTRIVFVGSSEVYGRPVAIPITEEHPLHPANPYAVSKCAADEYCRYATETFDMNIVRMRPFNHSGAGQSDRFALSSFARQIAAMEAGKQDPVLHTGNLDVARDFSHVDDVIRAYELALREGEAGGVYNICSGAARPVRAAVEHLAARVGLDVSIEVDPARVRANEVEEIRGSYEKLRATTGWTPERSYEDILDDLLEYWRSVESAGET